MSHPESPPTKSWPLLRSLAFLLLLCPATATAAAISSGNTAAGAWNVVILLIVLAACLGSGVLNLAAIRQWNRNWGLVSCLPLLGLAVWSAIILSAKLLDSTTHMLWQLEIFAWAMLNMIYMVTAMTAKRMFAKRDGES